MPPDRLSRYSQLWQHVRVAAEEAGARAWIFAAAANTDRFVEFIEWQSSGEDAIIDRDDVAAALQQLATAFPFDDAEIWKEAHF